MSRIDQLVSEIESAFSEVEVPSRFAEGLSQETFESWYAEENFRSMTREFYDLEPAEFRFLLPYAMKAYLNNYGKDIKTEVSFNLFLLSLGEFKNVQTFSRNRYLSMYGILNDQQRKCVCSFLNWLRMNDLDDGHIDDDVIQFWCGENQSATDTA